tara:strand:+ start:41 stop:466 length:426 start_codon:yes stop_codon:yes gene_type:complete
MSEFKQYKRKSISEMRSYTEGEILDDKVSISAADLTAGSPLKGDMIARSPNNHEDQWLVSSDYFKENLEEVRSEEELPETTYQDRVVAEHDSLELKVNALDAFRNTAKFRALSRADRLDLSSQLKAMNKYLTVLCRRVSKF